MFQTETHHPLPKTLPAYDTARSGKANEPQHPGQWRDVKEEIFKNPQQKSLVTAK